MEKFSPNFISDNDYFSSGLPSHQSSPKWSSGGHSIPAKELGQPEK